MRSFRASIDTGLPQLPSSTVPELHRELIKIYDAFKKVQTGIDSLNRDLGSYNVDTTYGQIVNVIDTSGAAHIRLASAAAGTIYPAYGFCPTPEGVLTGVSGEVQYIGLIQGLSGLTIGAIYYLSDTVPGGITSSKPVGAGKIVQPIGIATSSTCLFFNPTLLYTQL